MIHSTTGTVETKGRAVPTDWSDSIVVADLADEPAFSEELANIMDELERGSAGDDTSIPDVVLNMDEVSYLNSSNIAQILRLRKFLVEHDANLRLAATQDAVWSVMLLTGLDKVFHFVPDKATAIASLQLSQGDN